jgi:Holliday junction resolvase YEN1
MRCERLALLPVKAHFVFDGKERPRLKRDKNVRGTDHWSVDPFKLILDIFGFSHSEVGPPRISFYGSLTSFLLFWCQQALGEAEVELARMSQAGVIDLVFTEDSDAVVFGTVQVVAERVS